MMISNLKDRELVDMALQLFMSQLQECQSAKQALNLAKSLIDAAHELEKHSVAVRAHRNSPEGMIAHATRLLEDAQALRAAMNSVTDTK